MIKKLSVIAVCSLLLTSCTQPERSRRVLEDQGFTDIQIQPYSLRGHFSCSNDDRFRTPFIARSQNGKIVSGVVCSGIFKAATPRFY